MLGLADRSKILSLFKEILNGNEKDALKHLKDLIDSGLDAKNFLNDILEILYLFSRRINLGPIEKDMTISEAEVQLVDEFSKNIDMQDIGLFWQLTIKTIDDLRIIGNETLTLEMYLMQLVHLKNIDSKEVSPQENNIKKNFTSDNNLIGEKIKEEKADSETPLQVKNQLKNVDQVKTNPIRNLISEANDAKIEILKFQDLIDLANKEKEVELKFDLERNVKLVSFNKGKIDISFNENLNKNFIKNLTEKLLLWTGERWIISLSKNAEAKSIYEKKIEQNSFTINEFKKTDLAKQIENSFPDAKLVNIKEEEPHE